MFTLAWIWFDYFYKENESLGGWVDNELRFASFFARVVSLTRIAFRENSIVTLASLASIAKHGQMYVDTQPNAGRYMASFTQAQGHLYLVTWPVTQWRQRHCSISA